MKLELDVITPSEFSQAFHQGMVDRMEISFHKYGKVMDAKGKIDEVACLLKRIDKYRETGNTEWLMDVANFAMIEFMHRGKESFRATDSNESPGLKTVDGEILKDRHTEAPPPPRKDLDAPGHAFYKGHRGD